MFFPGVVIPVLKITCVLANYCWYEVLYVGSNSCTYRIFMSKKEGVSLDTPVHELFLAILIK